MLDNYMGEFKKLITNLSKDILNNENVSIELKFMASEQLTLDNIKDTIALSFRDSIDFEEYSLIIEQIIKEMQQLNNLLEELIARVKRNKELRKGLKGE